MTNLKLITAILVNAIVLSGCGSEQAGGGTVSSDTTHEKPNTKSSGNALNIPKGEIISEIEDGGVKVTFSLSKATEGKRWLKAKFSPTEKGYHLYSKDLPVDGLDGIGRPTLLALQKHGAITKVGSLTADKDVHILNSPLNADGFPVYPDGPVTLTLPFEISEGSNLFEVTASVTYMACTNSSCNPPVEGKKVTLQVK